MELVTIFSKRQVLYSKFHNIKEATKGVKLPSGYSIVCLFMNDFDFQNTELKRFFTKILRQGGVYFVVHGRHCSRVHDLIDFVFVKGVKGKFEEDGIIMTTWHDNEKEEEVVWFALNVAFPDDKFFDTWNSICFIEFSNETKSTKVEKLLSHVKSCEPTNCK